ncbi:alpha/beta fold hydrolase [Williamsia sp. CHRR-6]|uniref:alpha/beta fold hydrolase n=1 Tax=Williamsia sp. CHRR-6 TaxID=2835871 RepID=UPI001BDA2107|nr:alpha/beta fold hydrolase [Williamsia sp. CHRR-6]MBT0567868.1 alpha/beta fold hydrolase [Williamsia sp. CHRR-6]
MSARPPADRRSPDRLDAHKFASLAQAITAHAALRPAEAALVTAAATVTFSQLHTRVQATCPVVRAHSGPTRRPVAVDMDGTIESIVTAIAVIVAGVPLVPIDPNLPDARRALMVDLAEARVLHPGDLGGSVSAPESVLVDASPEDLAMILMTSGSAGAPKGVLLSHRMCLSKAYDVIGPLVLSRTDRLGNLLPLGFGAGMNTLLAGLLAGIAVVCRDPRMTDPQALRQWLRDEAVTTVHCSASLGRALAAAGGAGPDELVDVRVLVCYGEPIEGADLRSIRAGLAPAATLVNWYACTESGVVAFRSFPRDAVVPDGRVPAGRAVRGRQIMIVGPDSRPVAPGEVGEIWIGGGDFAVGYLGDRAPATVRTDSGMRWYRTGDRGRVDEQGSLHVVGRMASAVKIRGYLVEPGEVESALRRHAGVLDALVEGVTHAGHSELVAHVVLDSGVADRSARAVRAAVRADLPDWMVPRFVEIYDALPRTERGKVDRPRLRRPVERIGGDRAPQPLRTSDLTLLGVADMVRTVMGGADIGVDDDLIEAGADSLALTTILARVTGHFHVRLDLARVAADPTITTIAALAREAVAADARTRDGLSMLVPLRSGGTRAPLFIVPGAGAPAVSLIPMSRHLAEGRPVFGLQAWGLENRGRPDRSVPAAARRCVAAIRDVAPHGPYVIAGHSMGAHIAWEVAGRLRHAGETVEVVVLIDPHLSQPMIEHLRAGSEAEPALPAEPAAQLHSGATLDIGLRRLIGLRVKMMVAGLIQFDPLTQWLLFYNLGMATLARHRPRALDVPTAVLRTADNPHGREHWSLMATGPLHLTDVPGGHTDLLREPHVSSIAKAVDSAIDRLRA